MNFLVFFKALAATLLIAAGVCAQTGVIVRTMQQLTDEITAFNNGTGNRTITIGADFYVSSLLTVNSSGDTLTITSNSDRANYPYILTRNAAGNLITIAGNSTVILQNITFDGNINAFGQGVSGAGSLFLVGNNGQKGFLDMKTGATIRNNYNNHNGSGVYIDSTGEFNMLDGLITGNKSSGSGGGVFIQTNGAMFRMSGGEISYNSCGSSAASYSGGVHFAGGGSGGSGNVSRFILGGNAVIKNNTKDVSGGGSVPSNVYMGSGRYITLGNGVGDGTNGVPAPQTGMEVWITKTADSGVFVNGGASDGQQTYFKGDAGCSPTFNNGSLMIMCGYDISLDPSYIVFDTLGFGYTSQEISPKTVIVANVGEKPTGKLVITLRGADSNAFVIDTRNIHNLAVNGSDSTASFTVMPVVGLDVGTYNAFVMVSADMDNPNHVMTRRVFVEFTVGHNITWNVNCYGCANFTPTQTIVADGGSIADPSPNVPTTAGTVRQYYNFAGWFRDPALQIPAFPMANVSDETTLHAKWLPKSTPITYNLNGGALPSGDWGYSTYTIGINPLPIPTRDGYTFDGWFTNEILTYSISYIGYTVPPNPNGMQLWARWKANVYNITYELNDGTQQAGTWNSYTYGVGLALPTLPARSGFVFGGWFDNPDISGSPITTISATDIGNKTFWAGWRSISLNLTGTNNFASMQIDYPTAPTLTVVVENTGNLATGALTVAISAGGTNPDLSAFVISVSTIDNIAIDDNSTFTVRPTIGLDVGTYTATITVSNENENVAAQSFDVSFVVDAAPQPIPVAIPTLSRSIYVYNRQAQKPVFGNLGDDSLYELTDNQATIINVGNYTTTATLLNTANYVWADGTTAPIVFNWEIVPLQLTMTAPTITTTKVFDETNSAEAEIGELTNLISGDVVSVSILTSTYNSPNVSQANLITVVYQISGADMGNYTAPANFTIAGNITKADQDPPSGLGTIRVSNPSNMSPNGSIIGVSNKMEFAFDGGAGYMPISGTSTSISGLSVGKYFVRYKGDENHNPSPSVGLIISYAPFSLTVNANTGGTVSGTPSGLQNVGDLINVMATANAGFAFSYWDISGATIINDTIANPARFSMPANNVNLTANFTPTYTVSFDERGGTAIAPINNVVSGSRISAPSAVPTKSDSVFSGWYKEAACITLWDFGTDVVISDTMLFAKWNEIVLPRSQLTVNPGVNGTVSGTTSGIYIAQTAINVMATAYSGFVFTGWTITGAEIINGNTANPATFNMPENAVELTANFTQVYAVSFNSQGGTPIDNLYNVLSGSTIPVPSADPTKSNFVFGGWYKDADCTIQWFFGTDTVISDTTLFAKWNEIIVPTFPLTVNAGINGAISGTTSGNYIAQTSISVIATADSGFVFSGWTITGAEIINGNTANPAMFDMPANAVVLTANFTPTYTVSFNSQGGKPIDAIYNVLSGSRITAPSVVPTKSDSVFGGWYKDADCTTPWNFGADVVISDITLFAKWNETAMPTFSLTVNAGANGAVSGTASGNYVAQTTIRVIATADSGFAFTGWTITGATIINGNTSNPAIFSMPESAVILTANFMPTYTVSFNPQGGTPIDTIYNVVSGSKISAPSAVPTKSDYVFGGWYKDAAYTTLWNFGTDIVISDTTLFAKWSNVITLTVIAGANGTVSGTESGTYAAQTAISVMATAEVGFHFAYWVVSGAVIEGGNTANPARFNMPANAVKLMAVFEENKYTVIFNSEGGSRVPALENVPYNELISEPTTPPTRNGFDFVGWYKEAAYITLWNFETDVVISDTTTLFAKWEETANIYSISLNRGGLNIIRDEVYCDRDCAQPQTMSVNVFNTGNQPTGALSITLGGENADYFTLSATSIPSIGIGDSASFGITPKVGLNAGTYLATITVSGGNGITARSFDITFTVNKAPQDLPDEILPLDPEVIITHKSLELPTNDSLEYRLGRSGEWQDSPLFDGLEQDTEYWIFYRYKETRNYLPSDARVIYLKTFREHSRNRPVSEGNYGIRLTNNIVSQPVAIDVVAPENARISRVVVYDNLGNVVFTETGATVWNLTNAAGRFVANGTYLIVVEAVGVSGKTYGYTTKIGVRR
ncbi:MAG: InlB B-repeat-containing protein [Chitinivibrionia bacterium]|nr:InlB B-repeat-containing protein [Chitinivibrionia bacterium]